MTVSPQDRQFLKIVRDLSVEGRGVQLAAIAERYGDGASEKFLGLKDRGYLQSNRERGRAYLTEAGLRAASS